MISGELQISPVISKVFEHCVLDKFGHFLSTADNQFRFKKGLGCNHAIYTVRSVVEHFNNGGSTVNSCAIDLTKAFDKINHYARFSKLMKTNEKNTTFSIARICFTSKWK